MKRWLKWLGLGLIALILLVLLAATLLLTTEWGARFVLSQIRGFVPGELSVGRMEGSIAGPLTLEGIDYANEGLTVEAKRVRLDLDLSALFSGTARIESLAVNDVDITLPPPGPPEPESETGAPLQLPELALPLDVVIEALALKNIRVVPYQGEPIVIQSLALEAALVNGTLDIDRLNIDSSLGYLRLAAHVDTLDQYQSDLNAQYGWQRQEILIEGELELHGDLNRMQIESRVGAPVNLRLQARLQGVSSDLQYSADLRLAGLRLKAFGIDALPAPLEANISFDGGLQALSLEGVLASGDRRLAIESLHVTRNDERIVLHSLEIEGKGEARLSATGEVGLSGEAPVVDLNARWGALEIPIGPQEIVQSPVGAITVNGTLDDYELDAELQVRGAVPAGHWQLRGYGSQQAFTLEQLHARTLDGQISASGRVSWAPQLTWQLQLDTQGINPQALAPEWPGRISMDLDTEGAKQGTGFAGALTLSALSGQLRGRDIEANTDIEFGVRSGVQHIQGEAELYSGDSEILIAGQYGAQTDVNLSLQIPELTDLYPDAQGSLKGDLHLSGSAEELTLQGTLEGEAIVFGENRIGRVQTQFDLAQAQAAASELRLEAQNVQAAGITINQLGLALAGTRAEHQLNAKVTGPAGNLELALAGGLRDQVWRGTIETLRLASEQTGVWRLREAAQLEAGANLAQLQNFCLAGAQGELCAQGQWQAEQGLAADVTIDQLPLAAADPILTQALGTPAELEGFLNGDIRVNTTPRQPPLIDAHIQARDAALRVTQSGTVHSLTFNPLSVRAMMDEGELNAELDLVIEELGSVRARVQSPSFDLDAVSASPVDGNIALDIRTLKPLAPFLGPLVETDGQIAGEIQIGGSVEAVNLGGEIDLREFTTRVPAAGLQLTDGRLSLRATGERLRFEGVVTSGDGELVIDGQARFPADAPVQVEAKIGGERFLAVDIPGVAVFISPALSASVDGRRVELTGDVKIPEATIDLGELEGGGPESVGTSPDVVVVGAEQEQADAPLQLYAEIDVILGEDIEIVGQGFEGGVDGQLHVSVAPGEPALGSGELLISGTYKAYGQDLTIREGRLLYSDSPLDNPGLEIVAVRAVEDVTAGVRISGTAQSPELTLFSDPPLGSDAEILSYLVLGKPLNQASDGEGLNLQRQATIKGAGLLAQELGARLGIENVAVEETDTGTSLLSIGRYLSPRLYLSYGVGILEPVTVVKLQYELSDLWTLEASSGTETRAGIRFELEQ